MFWAPGQPRTATVARPPATGSRREARGACSRRPARLADAPAAERLAALSETKNRPVWRHHESSAVVRGNPRANCTRNGVRPRLAAAVPPKNYGHDATMRGFRTERGGRRATHLFAVVYRANPATVCILMHNFRPDCTGRIQPCLEVTVRPSRYPALRQSGKHRRTASRSGPGLSLRRDIRSVLTVDNASVRLARSHVHTGFTERLRLEVWSKRSAMPVWRTDNWAVDA